MLLVLFAVAVVFFFIHLSDIWDGVIKVLAVLSPIVYGLVIAYILNYPYKLFHDYAFKNMGKKHQWLSRVRLPLSLLLSYLIVIGIAVFLVSILIPELTSSVKTLINNIPVYENAIKVASDDVAAFVKTKTGYNLYDLDTYTSIIKLITGSTMEDYLTKLAAGIVPSVATTVVDIAYTLYYWIMGIVISIYLLASKDTLLRQSRKLIVAYTPAKFSKRFFKIANVTNNKCGKFLIGKIIDSSIIGIMCFIGMSIFQFHYSLLISFIIGVMNMIPFFGPILGAIPCTILLLIINPIEALLFVIFIVGLQWFDGNILGPKILGESVGISGFWIMVSVIIGGGLFGVPGMILGVPVFAAIYVLIKEGVDVRIENKKLKAKVSATASAQPAEPVPEPSEESNNL